MSNFLRSALSVENNEDLIDVNVDMDAEEFEVM